MTDSVEVSALAKIIRQLRAWGKLGALKKPNL